MKSFTITLLVFFCLPAFSIFNGKHKRVQENQIKQLIVRYEPKTLRIPGNNLPIGLTVVLKGGEVISTRGFLNGNLIWRNFKIEVEGGNFCFGKINLTGDETYKKGKKICIKVFGRKSKNLIHTQEIAYNYETEIEIITKGNFKKAPGNKIDIGIRTFYNNEFYSDFWPKNNNQLNKQILPLMSGGYLSSGNLYINDDPFTIIDHKVILVARLNKYLDIADTLQVTLDYRDNYYKRISGSSGSGGSSGWSGSSGSTGCNGSDGGNGQNGNHGYNASDLEVYVDVYFDTLINEQLMFLNIKSSYDDEYRYLVNTDGGTIDIISSGGDGGDGGSGGSGGSGGKGADGVWETIIEKINDSTFVEKKIQHGGQNGGNGGRGGNGGSGGNGGAGGDISIYYTVFAREFLGMIDARSISGDGGDGGNSGNGGSGGSGGTGNPSGNSGSGGSSGSCGSAGYNGSHGDVEYFYINGDNKLEAVY